MTGKTLRQALQYFLKSHEKLWLFCDFIQSQIQLTKGFDLFLKDRNQ